MSTCPHCGSPRWMEWNAGYLVWICPQERAGFGNHPGSRTSNSTLVGPASPIVIVTK